jgi:preprotein translocase subunit SecD
MKRINFLAAALLVAFCSCTSGVKTNAQKVSFGIYETVKVREIPSSRLDKLKETGIRLEKDTGLPIIGYLLQTDSLDYLNFLADANLKLLKTAYPIDKQGLYLALVATEKNPVISIADIHDTKTSGKNVEIHFNLAGAKKWADMTRSNLGNMVAFTIDDKIYTMPYVNGEIRGGVALINGLKDEATAKRLSEALNSSLSD